MPGVENRKNFIINFIYASIIVLIVYLSLKYLLAVLLPFAIGFLAAALLNTPVRYLSRKAGLSTRFTAVVAVILFYTTAGVLISLAGVKLFVAAGNLFLRLPLFYNETVAPLLSDFFDFAGGILEKFDGSAVSGYETIFSDAEISLGSAISALSVKVLGYISSVASDLPMFVVGVLLTVISTFFFAADYGNITRFLLSLLPKKSGEKLLKTKKCLYTVLLKYFKSYFLIMLITFAELSLGLTVCNINNAFLLAFIISLVDILPVLGTGIVLVPWAIIELLNKNYPLGIKLLIVYGAVTVVRNVIEPKIVGREVGLHPALTLISMYVGTKLFGFIGLFALPIALSVMKSLQDCGQLNLFSRRDL